MILIIEGLDNTGKSTLIKQIRKSVLTNPLTTTMHCSSTPKDADDSWPHIHYDNLLQTVNELSLSGWDIILDRSHIGECVYGPLFRNVSDTKYIFDIEKNRITDTAALILLTDTPDRLLEREDGDTISTNIEDINNVANLFLTAYRESSIKHKMHYDISKDGGFDGLFPTVKEFILNVKNK